MNLRLGLLPNSFPHQTRIFMEAGAKLLDLSLVYAAHLAADQDNRVTPYELAACYFHGRLDTFLERGEPMLKALEETSSFIARRGLENLHGPGGEQAVYEINEVRLLPPFPNPEKCIVIGFSDRARAEATPIPEIPTGFYKLPCTFITSGAPIVWPKFSRELDCDACLAVVIGAPGKRIAADRAWQHVAGFTLLLDVTARDINQREGLTTNNLLGKNFPSSTSLGPALHLTRSKTDFEDLEIELMLDGIVMQKFKPASAVFSVPEIIARWSILGLKPGDILAIGASMTLAENRLQRPVPLTQGAKICCSAFAIGALSHRVGP